MSASTKTKGFMAFTRPQDVSDDPERKGVKRAEAKDLTQDLSRHFDFRTCDIHDCLASAAPSLNIKTMGFDTISLASSKPLQNILADIKVSGRVDEFQAEEIRRLIKKGSFKLSNGETLRLLYVAPEGFIVRKAGPNGMKADPDEKMDGSNGHEGAVNVHGDQDVYGTPIKQILKGFGPYLFNHKTPDGENNISPLFLINLWIPLQQITRPLTLMDRRTLNNKEHQLRYSLATDNFLEREEDQIYNDIWTFQYDDDQMWYFHSEMGPDKAYIFDTLGEPHGAFISPGEKRAEHLYKKLKAVLGAVNKGDAGEIQSLSKIESEELPEATTKPLRAAVATMETLLQEAGKRSKTLAIESTLWRKSAEEVLDSLIRKSLEMRVVGLITPF